jgi:hypothetical protein
MKTLKESILDDMDATLATGDEIIKSIEFVDCLKLMVDCSNDKVYNNAFAKFLTCVELVNKNKKLNNDTLYFFKSDYEVKNTLMLGTKKQKQCQWGFISIYKNSKNKDAYTISYDIFRSYEVWTGETVHGKLGYAVWKADISANVFDNFKNKVEIYKIPNKGKNIDAVTYLRRYNEIKSFK